MPKKKSSLDNLSRQEITKLVQKIKSSTDYKHHRCKCGVWLEGEDRDFWGECKKCRLELPIHTANTGDNRGTATDRAYHGSMFHNGEF